MIRRGGFIGENKYKKRDKFRKFFQEQNYLAVLLGFALLFINILLLTKISFVFTPFIVFLKTIFFPVLLAGVLFYILHPFVSLLEKKGVSRIVSIASIYLMRIRIICIFSCNGYPYY